MIVVEMSGRKYQYERSGQKTSYRVGRQAQQAQQARIVVGMGRDVLLLWTKLVSFILERLTALLSVGPMSFIFEIK